MRVGGRAGWGMFWVGVVVSNLALMALADRFRLDGAWWYAVGYGAAFYHLAGMKLMEKYLDDGD